MVRLKEELLPSLKKNKSVNARIQLELNKSSFQVNRYFDTNHIILTTTSVLNIIEQETGMLSTDVLNDPILA